VSCTGENGSEETTSSTARFGALREVQAEIRARFR
jgi:hypothetical protein